MNSTIALPAAASLPLLLDASGEGQAVRRRLGIVDVPVSAEGLPASREALAEFASDQPAVAEELMSAMGVIDTATRRLEVTIDAPEPTPLLAFVAGNRTCVLFVKTQVLLLRVLPTLQLPDALLELIAEADEQSHAWRLTSWTRDELTTSARSSTSGIEAGADSEQRLRRLEQVAGDLTGLVTQIALDTI